MQYISRTHNITNKKLLIEYDDIGWTYPKIEEFLGRFSSLAIRHEKVFKGSLKVTFDSVAGDVTVTENEN